MSVPPSKRVLAAAAVLVGIVVAGPPLVVESFYRYTLREPISAWGWAWRFAVAPQSMLTPRRGERMATRAARAWITPLQPPRGMGRWHQRFWASALWMCQHRTAAQLTQFVMDAAYFGRGARGFDAASLAYFGRPSGDLAPHEIALLVAIEVSPRRYNVDCRPEESIAARNRLLGKLLSAGAISRLDHDGAVAQELGVLPRACEPTTPTSDGDGDAAP